MKAIKVQYKVKPEFIDQNKANIQKVMDRLIAKPIEGMLYSSYTLEDGETFIHINMAVNDETLRKLNDVKEFKAFRKALMESEPVEGPRPTQLNLVAAGFEF